MFRNGMMLTYNENVQAATEKQLNDWLTAENTLKIIGVIDEVYKQILKCVTRIQMINNDHLGKHENAEQHH